MINPQKDELYLIWFLNREYEYDNSKFHNALTILNNQFQSEDFVHFKILITRLEHIGYIKVVDSHNDNFQSRITKDGLTFYQENEYLFQSFSLESGRRDFFEADRDGSKIKTEVEKSTTSTTSDASQDLTLQQKEIIKLSDEILLFLLDWRETRDPNLKFWFRSRHTERLTEGKWFAEDGNYIRIGFTQRNDVNDDIKTVCFIIKLDGNKIADIYFRLSFSGEDNEDFLSCYESIVETFDWDNEKPDEKKYYKHYLIKSWKESLETFLLRDWPKAKEVIKDKGLIDDFEIPDSKFESMLSKTLIIRNGLGYDPISYRPKPSFDKSAFLWSDAAAEADELGRESLVRSVTRSIDELFVKYKDAYTILLNGEWGSGKSSMLNFFEEHLDKSGWEVIRYDAWENQKFKDPWWILINKISKYASKNSLEGDFSSHGFWKFKLQYKHKIFALLLIVVFGLSASYFFMKGGGPDETFKFSVPIVASLVGLITTVITATTGIINNFFFKSISHDELKNRFTEHPFEPIRKRFNEIAKDNRLAIFIDNLDRCDVDATVSLLEGIQNLFKEMPVLYIIAADGQWVSNCFNEKYKVFENNTNVGCTIGDKFLQKTFQLTLNVPKPDSEYLEPYWDNLIGHKDPVTDDENYDSDNRETYQASIDQKKQKKDKEQDDEKEKFEENLEKYLRKFRKMGVPDNPRQMKRFVSQFEVARQTLVVEGNLAKYDEDKRLVMYLIFVMKYPSLADKLKKGEISIDEIRYPDKKENQLKLTDTDKTDIKKLLDGIEVDLIKGDFYSI